MKQWIDKLPWGWRSQAKWALSGYIKCVNTGVELVLDHMHSLFLKPTNDLCCFHNLEALVILSMNTMSRGILVILSTKNTWLLPSGNKTPTKNWSRTQREGGVQPKRTWIIEESHTDGDCRSYYIVMWSGTSPLMDIMHFQCSVHSFSTTLNFETLITAKLPLIQEL